MLKEIHPKLPMRDPSKTRSFYLEKLNFSELGDPAFQEYVMVRKGPIEIHFFLHNTLDPKENYGQVYIRTDFIQSLYRSFIEKGIEIHPMGQLSEKPWGQLEFSILDPDNNLLTFGQSI